ncbi:hypothetical protein ABZU45_40645, partial [Streptomyces avermitilis]|uniref:DUF485 domain-containing protein n=1 Tax=Streptomyces avermitilis TaxID=33903 RepID=UPI0034727A17
LYVLLSNYAGGFMGTKLFGNVNVALVLGLAHFRYPGPRAPHSARRTGHPPASPSLLRADERASPTALT